MSQNLWDNGKLAAAENCRHLQYANGKPFFWIGDTCWLLVQKLNRDEIKTYFAARKAKVGKQEFPGFRDDAGVRVKLGHGIGADATSQPDAEVYYTGKTIKVRLKNYFWQNKEPTQNVDGTYPFESS